LDKTDWSSKRKFAQKSADFRPLFQQKAIVKADEKIFLCAAASIIAKVTRDRIMQKMHKKYPEYGFDKHKGYGTKEHLRALKKYGPCKMHRKSFGPVKRIINNQ
jgi:ribonuclease HII